MEESEVLKVVQAELDRAESFVEARISVERAAAYDYYYGKPFGNEMEGRSQVVSADVAQAIDSAMPQLLEVFVSGDKAVEFTPRGPEDVEASEKATLGCNYVFFTQNNGYAIAHDFLKDGLLQKTGVFKWKWDTSTVISEKRYQGLDEMSVQILQQDPQLEILSASPSQQQVFGPDGQPIQLLDVVVRQKKEAGRVRVIVPPPEEVLISPDAMSLDVMDMPFIAHTPLLTASDLIEMGITQDVIDLLPGDDRDTLFADEKIARKDRTDSSASMLDSPESEASQRTYRYNECYIKIDEDGDGVAELRKICTVGDYILHDEVTDHIPMAVWTPKVMPHEVIGVSLADDIMDIQLWKSVILRGINDSMYQSIAPRMFVQGDVNLDDVLTVKPGGVIRGELNSMLTPITVPFVGQQAFPMLEYADQEKSSRIGFSALGPGLDPDSINKTATFVKAMQNQTGSRAKIMARNAAEYGFKPLFKGIMYLLAKHQTQALMVRLSNKFVPIDPETWSKEYDMSCNVGLGVGNKEEQQQQLMVFGQYLAQIGGTPFAQQLLDAKKVFNYGQKLAELMGHKDVTTFLNDPEGTQPPPPPKPPEVQVAEIEAQTSMQKSQLEQQGKGQELQAKTMGEVQKFQAQAGLDQAKMQQEMALAREEMALKIEFEREKMQAEFQFKLAEKQMELEAQREIAHMGAQSTVKAAYASAGSDDPENEDVKKERAQEKMENRALLQQIAQLIAQSGGPKEIVRGKDGRAIGVRPV